MNLLKLSKEELQEESMIDIAYAILTDRHQPLTLQQLLDEIRELTGMTERQVKDKLLQFYTDMNIDGRFLAINNNEWGLREWYPVDQIEEETAPVVKVRKKKKKKAYDDEDEDEEEEDEIDEDELFEEEFDELDDDDDVEDEEEEEEIIEIEEDLIDDDEELEIVPDDELDIDVIDEEEEEEDEEEEDLL